jgi:uncharacterized protein YoxC
MANEAQPAVVDPGANIQDPQATMDTSVLLEDTNDYQPEDMSLQVVLDTTSSPIKDISSSVETMSSQAEATTSEDEATRSPTEAAGEVTTQDLSFTTGTELICAL